jgi:hypothetical protein
MEIQPIETYVFDGLIKRFSMVFGCKCMFVTVQDKTRSLQKFFDGREVEYPYAFLTVQNVAVDHERYANRRLSRRGVRVVVGQDQQFTARLVPTNFVIEVEFHTNKFNGMDKATVMSYARRWLFAAQCGFLKFNIQYGQLDAWIGVTMDDTVPTPPLENRAEQEASYKIVSSLTVHGWTSEPVLGSQGIISDLDVSLAVATDGAIEGYVFEPFN